MDFSPTARYYHLLEDLFIGSALQQTRVAQLRQLALNQDLDWVLIVGEGNGRFLCALLQAYPKLNVTVIDASAAMLERTRRRLNRAGLSHHTVRFELADLRSRELPSAHYGLIVTHFFFSNFGQSDVAQMIRQLAHAAGPDALWLLGDFVVPANAVLGMRAKFWLWALYRFFRYTAGVPVRRLPEVEGDLAAAGFQVCAESLYCGQLLRSATYRRASGAQVKLIAAVQ